MADYEVQIIPEIKVIINAPDETPFVDSIKFDTWTEMKGISKAERDALIDQRYQEYLIAKTTPTEPPIEEV